MEYSIDNFIAALPKGRQKKIEKGFQKMKAEYLALSRIASATLLTGK